MFAVWMSLQFFACKGCNQEEKPIDTGLVGEEFSNDWGKWLGLAASIDNQPLIAYYDSTHGALGLATGTLTETGVTWTHEEIDGYPNTQGLDEGDRGQYASMKVTSAGDIWISYYDVSLKTLKYASKSVTAEGWTIGVADTGSGGTPDAGLYGNMALDANEKPVIVHYDRFRKNLRVAHLDDSGVSFTGMVVDEGQDYDNGTEIVDANTGMFPSIDIDGSTEYIAYYDVAAGNLMLSHGTAGSYTTEIVDSVGDVGQWTSIDASDGIVYITYQDLSNNQIKLAFGTPGSWNTRILDIGNALGADSNVLDAASGLTVVYHDGYNNDIKMAKRNSDGTWNTQQLGGVDLALGFHNELVEIDGSVYAACYNYTDQNVWFRKVD